MVELGDELEGVPIQDLFFVVLVLYQVVQALLEAVEEDCVLVDVLEEVLSDGKLVHLEL